MRFLNVVIREKVLERIIKNILSNKENVDDAKCYFCDSSKLGSFCSIHDKINGGYVWINFCWRHEPKLSNNIANDFYSQVKAKIREEKNYVYE